MKFTDKLKLEMIKKHENIIGKRGGKRAGAGRPKGDPTKTLSFRVKLTEVDELKQLVKDWKSTKNQNQ